MVQKLSVAGSVAATVVPSMFQTIYFCIFSNTQNQKGDKLTNMMLPMAEGEQWKALRAAMSPTFSTGKLKLVRALSCHLSNSTMWSTQRDSPIPIDVLIYDEYRYRNTLLSRLTVLASVDPGIPLFPKKVRILYFADRFKSHLKSCRKFRNSNFLKISDNKFQISLSFLFQDKH